MIGFRLAFKIPIDAGVIPFVGEGDHELQEAGLGIAQPCVGLDERIILRIKRIALPARRLIAPDCADGPPGDSLRRIRGTD